MKTYKSILNIANDYSLLLAAFFIPFPQKSSSTFLIIWFSISFLNIQKRYFLEIQNKWKSYTVHLLLLFLFLTSLASVFFYPDINKGLNTLIGPQFPILLIPLFMLITQQRVDFLDVLKAYIGGCFVFIIWKILIVEHSIIQSIDVFYYKDFWEQLAKDFSGTQHRTYIGVNLLIGVIASIYLIKNKVDRSIHSLLYLYIFASVGFIYILASRAVAISLVFLFFYYVVVFFKYFTKSKFIVGFLFVVVTLIFFLSNSRFIDTFTQISKSNITQVDEPRFKIWQVSTQLIKDMPLFGYGSNSIEHLLVEKYTDVKFQEGINCRYGTHNQYLEFLMQFGWFGLFLLLAILVMLGYYSKEKSLFYIPFTLVFALNFFFETMLNRSSGVITFVFFCSIYNFIEIDSKHIKSFSSKVRYLIYSAFGLLIVFLIAFYFKVHQTTLYLNKSKAFDAKMSEFKEDKIYKFDKTAKSFLWETGAYFHYPYLVAKVSERDTFNFSVDCFVSKDYNGTYAKIVVESVQRAFCIDSATYNLGQKGTWQNLSISASNRNDKLFVLMYLHHNNYKNFDSLTGYVLFKNPNFYIKPQ